MRSTLAYQTRRHPFIVVPALIVFGPYILGFVLVFAALFAVAVVLDALLLKHR